VSNVPAADIVSASNAVKLVIYQLVAFGSPCGKKNVEMILQLATG
jgi:hypothetical protein